MCVCVCVCVTGLLDQPGGERELIVTVDDIPIKDAEGNEWRSLPRADVAEVCVHVCVCGWVCAHAPVAPSSFVRYIER